MWMVKSKAPALTWAESMMRELMRDPSFSCQGYHPSVRTDVTDGKLVTEIDMPGVKRDELSVTVTGSTLNVSTESKARKFSCAYTVSDAFAPETAEASLADGVLKITMAPATSAKIEIK